MALKLLVRPKLLSLTKVSNVRHLSVKASEAEKRDPEWESALPYNQIPGPGKITLVRQFMKGGKYHGLAIVDMHRALRSDYGDIIRIPGLMGRGDTLITFNPKMFEKVFRTEGPHPRRRGLETFTYYRKIVRPEVFGDTGGLISEQGQSWFNARSKVNPVMLQPKTVKMYVEKVDNVALDFLTKIVSVRNRETNEMPSNFGHELNKWALESIGVIALDDRLGALMDDSEDGRRIIELVKNFFVLSYELDVALSIWKYYKTPQFKKLMWTFDQMTEVIMKYVDQAVERLDASASSENADNADRSILEKLLKIDRKIAIVMAFDMLLAGVDTTSAAVVSCLYHLAKNPEKQARLREEVLKVLPNKNSEFTSALNNMVYLKACFKEALRLNPVIAGNARGTGRDIVLGGYQVPKGVEVAMGTVVLQTDETYFPKTDHFIPERWLKDGDTSIDVPSVKSTSPFVYLPFGFGPRSCIGRRFAEMEVEVLLTRIIRQFSVEYHYGPLKYNQSLILSPNEDVKFKFVDLPY